MRWTALCAVALGTTVAAHEAPEHASGLGAVEVTGHYDNAVGTSDAASQGVVTSRLLETRPAMRPGEVLEFIPGVIVTQHSGDGKANQYFLRGFNLDHGTDFSTWIAGMPVNLPTHAHGHGYTDLGFLIPELIDRIEYRKGPYFASSGDFASAGSADIRLRNAFDANFTQLTLGAFGFQRLLGGASRALENGRRLLGAVELQRADGPWDTPQGLRRQNAVLRLSDGTAANGLDVTLMAYRARWRATDQIPQRAVDSGLLGRFGTLDATDGGETTRYSLSTEMRRSTGDGGWRASLYAIHYELDLWSNFTYSLERPDTGDQFLQKDRRNVFGGQLARSWYGRLGSLPMSNEVGVQARADRIRVGLFDTVAREVAGTTRDDRVAQSSIGIYAENGIEWTGWLRSLAGVRADRFDWHVESDRAANGGSTSAMLASPKASLILGPWSRTEYFVNWGRGFHSNDARGTVARVDPKTGAPVSPVPGLVRTAGRELGVRTELLPRLQSSLALWRLDIGSELLFVGDAGITEPSRPSRRRGLEWNTRYQPMPWMILDFDYAQSAARFVDGAPEADRVPGSVGRVVSAAVGFRDLWSWSGSVQVRHLGTRPLTEDGSVIAPSTTLLNARLGYRFGSSFDLTLDVFNLANRKVNDIEYFYVSRLPGEPAAGVSDRHVHPVEPRSFRLTATVRF